MKYFATIGYFLLVVVFYIKAAASASEKCARIYLDLPEQGVDSRYQGEWGGICNTGTRQSPINIDPTNVSSNNKSITPLKFDNWEEPQNLIVQNAGSAVVVYLERRQGKRPSLSGGGLDGNYVLSALVFHWPNDHTINRNRADLGINFVFYSDKYTCYEDAVPEEGARAIVNIGFIIEKDQGPPAFDSIARAVKQVAHRTGGTKKTSGVDLGDLLGPDCTNGFYRYDGSVPVPGCKEGIIWFVLPETGKVGTDQFKTIREIYDQTGTLVSYAARDIQPLNDRIVYHGSCENNEDSRED